MTILNAYLEGDVAGAGEGKYPAGTHRRLGLTGLGALRTAQVEPKYAELARAGRLWICGPGVIANHVAAVTDIPTTASAYSLYLPSTATVKVVVLELFAVTSGTSGVGGALLIGTPQTEATAVTTNTTGVVVKNTLDQNQTAPFFWATGVTLDATPAWMVVASVEAAVVKSGIRADLGGAIVVKPGQVFSTHYYSDTGTSPKAGIGALVATIDLDAAY